MVLVRSAVLEMMSSHDASRLLLDVGLLLLLLLFEEPVMQFEDDEGVENEGGQA